MSDVLRSCTNLFYFVTNLTISFVFYSFYFHMLFGPVFIFPSNLPEHKKKKLDKNINSFSMYTKFHPLHHVYVFVCVRAGDLPVEEVPQLVLLTFDDSVNDLNKQLYNDLFNKGRVNPNGCPLSATFYVSHEWTDYSQVQNLYAEGHEMASHTVS